MITNKNHLETVVGSLNKMILIAQQKGVLNSKELFLVNLIGKIILEDHNEMSFKDKQRLINMYFAIINKYSKIICKSELKRNYAFTSYLDANTIPSKCYIAPLNKSILYWQEVYTLNNSQITDLVDNQSYLIDKPSDTYENFEIGKNIDYTKVGKIVFLALESDTVNYIIKDVLNNDVTHTFNISLIPQLNATLFISDNNYSHGIMNFKIIKQ